MMRRPRFQFSLAACLIVTTSIAVVIGRATSQARRQAAMVGQITRHGGKLTFEPRQSIFARLATPLAGIISDEYFREPVGIDLRHKSTSLDLLTRIGHCRGIRSLDLRACGVTDRGLALLARLDRLESLDLSRNPITPASLAWLGDLAGLYHLELSENDIADEGIEHLARLPRLFSLSLDQTDIGDAAMPWIGRIANLRNLEIAETRVTDVGLSALSSLTKLARLRIGTAGRITDRGLGALREVPTLSHLSLVELSLTDESLKILAELPRLKYLNLERGEADFEASALKQLKIQLPLLTIQGDARFR